MEEKPEVTKPQISEKTKKEMAEFFMKTAIPRMIAEQEEKARRKNLNEDH